MNEIVDDNLSLENTESSKFNLQIFKSFFKKKFNIFALLQMVVAIILFSTMIAFVIPAVKDTILYLHEIDLDPDDEIYGYTLLFHSRSFFYLFMFSFQIIYSIYGAFQILRYHNERQAFKIMFRSIFYTAGILTMHYLVFIFIFLLSPIKDPWSIFSLLVSLSFLEVAIGGRLVSNFLILNCNLKTRKKIAIISLTIFTIACIAFSIKEHFDGEYDQENVIFFSFEIVSAIFTILATIYFTDPQYLQFKPLPKPNKAKAEIEIDIPNNLSIIANNQFLKNTRLTKATIPDGIREIGIAAFANCLRIKELYLPKSLTIINANAFYNCESLMTIIYEGTREEFKKISLGANWLSYAKTNVVYCSDGPVAIAI